jgi:hypothetical protein
MLIPVVLAGLVLAIQTPAPGDDKSERLKRALDWYADPDPDVRELGRKELVAIGPEAVPFLEKLLELRNALDIYKLLREVDKARNPLDPRWVGALPTDEDLQKELTPADKSETDRYVRRKYAEGVAAAKKGLYQRGYDIAHSLLLLEPKSPHAAKIGELRRYCDNWLTQTGLLRSRVVASSATAIVGEKAELMLRLENVFKQSVKLVYERGTAEKPTKALVVVEVTCNLMHPNGTVTQATRTLDVEIEHEVPIAMGAQWEKVFAVDTTEDFSKDADYVRVYTVGAWTQPMRMEYATANTTRRILFEPFTLKVVPKKHEHMIADPLGSLEKAIAAGTINEVFVAATLVADKDKPQAVVALVDLMEKADQEAARVDATADARKKAHVAREYTVQILTSITGQRFGPDVKKWRAYADALAPDKPKK